MDSSDTMTGGAEKNCGVGGGWVTGVAASEGDTATGDVMLDRIAPEG
jgi:hypothetical protein